MYLQNNRSTSNYGPFSCYFQLTVYNENCGDAILFSLMFKYDVQLLQNPMFLSFDLFFVNISYVSLTIYNDIHYTLPFREKS